MARTGNMSPVFDIKGWWRRFPFGAPSRYAVLMVILSVLWFPVRFWIMDRGDPLPEVIAGAAFGGAIWALFPWSIALSQPRGSRPPDDAEGLSSDEIRNRARRGALLGMGIGVLYFGNLIAMSLVALPERWLYAATFAVILALMGVAAVVSLRRASARAGAERA